MFSLAAVLAVGCSKSDRDTGTVPVSGKVTHGGQPLAGAVVTFVSDAGLTPGAGMSDADGGYSLRVKPGSYTATVSKLTGSGDTKTVSMEDAMANADKPREGPKETLPSKYQSPVESPLKFEVKPSGSNTFDLSLSD
ncbi:MAG TPA: carboxypeptidase-like regulatory domain-containing protein [Pirellulales bacterium]|nr:carboxypeptidase-like regulatory domain-containing protein [Pirellulales bacterium]